MSDDECPLCHAASTDACTIGYEIPPDSITVTWDAGENLFVALLNGDFLARGVCLSETLLRAAVRCEHLEDEAGTDAVIQMSVDEELKAGRPWEGEE